MDTRCRAGASKRDNLADLPEREPEAAALLDESEDADHIGRVDAVAGRGPARRWQNPPRLVQPHRLATGSAPFGDLANEKGASIHGHTLNPAPWGKVNH